MQKSGKAITAIPSRMNGGTTKYIVYKNLTQAYSHNFCEKALME